MAASKKKAAARSSGSKEVANVDQELANEVAGIKERVGAPETNAISIRDKMFTFPDGRVIDGAMHMVIVDFMNWNMYYADKFDPQNPKPPVCFAAAKEMQNLAPSENSPEPQASECNGCWANEFGSDGNGKACKNTRRLVVLDPEEDPAEATLYTLSVPPTSTKGFDAFVNGVARLHQKPPIAVVAKVMFHPEKNYPTLVFTDPQPNETYREHFARRDEAREMLEAEPDMSNYEPPRGRGAATKKTASKKKAGARR